jgi:hydrogenase nickel incorporation protein HypA/HybF
MHELSIALSILDVAGEEMQGHNGAKLEAIHVRLGPLSGVVKESLLSAYELARAATPFASARLVFEDCPIVVFCAQCQAERSVESLQRLCCVECGTPAVKIVRGRELELAALEIED